MSVARFAGNFLRFAKPNGLGGLAMRLAPDAAMAGLYALTAPEDYVQSPAERAGLFVQDLALGGLSGMAAAGLAGATGKALGMRAGRARRLAGTADWIGSISVPMVAYSTGLAPVTAALDRRAAENAELQAEMDRKGAFEQGLMAAAQGIGNTPLIESIDRVVPYG